ncbi:MAG: ATP-dependent dethiobiotin synthetase BioD, partial [Shewanella sp.]
IAAKFAGVSLTPESIISKLDLAAMAAADVCLIEGAGGWRLPLGEGRYFSEVAKQLKTPVILVVGMKLGCLNHALLTQEAILADGLSIAGWVANRLDPQMSVFDENLASLQQMMSAPCLGCVPFLAEPSAELAADFLDVTPLGL